MDAGRGEGGGNRTVGREGIGEGSGRLGAKRGNERLVVG